MTSFKKAFKQAVRSTLGLRKQKQPEHKKCKSCLYWLGDCQKTTRPLSPACERYSKRKHSLHRR